MSPVWRHALPFPHHHHALRTISRGSQELTLDRPPFDTFHADPSLSPSIHSFEARILPLLRAQGTPYISLLSAGIESSACEPASGTIHESFIVNAFILKPGDDPPLSYDFRQQIHEVWSRVTSSDQQPTPSKLAVMAMRSSQVTSSPNSGLGQESTPTLHRRSNPKVVPLISEDDLAPGQQRSKDLPSSNLPHSINPWSLSPGFKLQKNAAEGAWSARASAGDGATQRLLADKGDEENAGKSAFAPLPGFSPAQQKEREGRHVLTPSRRSNAGNDTAEDAASPSPVGPGSDAAARHRRSISALPSAGLEERGSPLASMPTPSPEPSARNSLLRRCSNSSGGISSMSSSSASGSSGIASPVPAALVSRPASSHPRPEDTEEGLSGNFKSFLRSMSVYMRLVSATHFPGGLAPAAPQTTVPVTSDAAATTSPSSAVKPASALASLPGAAPATRPLPPPPPPPSAPIFAPWGLSGASAAGSPGAFLAAPPALLLSPASELLPLMPGSSRGLGLFPQEGLFQAGATSSIAGTISSLAFRAPAAGGLTIAAPPPQPSYGSPKEEQQSDAQQGKGMDSQGPGLSAVSGGLIPLGKPAKKLAGSTPSRKSRPATSGGEGGGGGGWARLPQQGSQGGGTQGAKGTGRAKTGAQGQSFWPTFWDAPQDVAAQEEEEAEERGLLPPLMRLEPPRGAGAGEAGAGARAGRVWPWPGGSRRTLVLDLDETLVHSSFTPPQQHEPDYVLDVPVEGGRIMKIYVLKRPGVHEFLEAMAGLFEVVVFTASMPRYADPLLNLLDPEGRLIQHRLFRDSCSIASGAVPAGAPGGGQQAVVHQQGGYVKDLTRLGRDLSHTIIVDNSPQSFAWQPSNGLLVPNFIDDMQDDVLLRLIPFLSRIATSEGDVRLLLKGAQPQSPGAGQRRSSGGEGSGSGLRKEQRLPAPGMARPVTSSGRY